MPRAGLQKCCLAVSGILTLRWRWAMRWLTGCRPRASLKVEVAGPDGALLADGSTAIDHDQLAVT